MRMSSFHLNDQQVYVLFNVSGKRLGFTLCTGRYMRVEHLVDPFEMGEGHAM